MTTGSNGFDYRRIVPHFNPNQQDNSGKSTMMYMKELAPSAITPISQQIPLTFHNHTWNEMQGPDSLTFLGKFLLFYSIREGKNEETE